MYKIIGGDGKEYGPVSADDVRQWIAEGRANGQTRVQAEGSADWQPLGSLPEFGLSPDTAAPAPPLPGTAPVLTFIKVFSIFNMVLGGLGLLCTPFSFIAMHMVTKATKTLDHVHLVTQTVGNSLMMSPLMRNWLVFSSVWGVIGSGILLASGIGLWKRRSWARKLAVGYAVLAIVLGLAGIVIVIIAFGGGGGGNELEHVQRIGGIVSGVIGGLVGLVYNVLMIVFLNKPSAKQATGEIA